MRRERFPTKVRSRCWHLCQESRVSERFLKCASNEGERAHRELREKRRCRARGSRSPSTSSASRHEKYRSLAVRRETRASRRRRRAGWSHHRRRAFDGTTRVRTNRALEASRRRCATRRPRERVVTSRLRGLSSHTRPTSTRLGRHARRDVDTRKVTSKSTWQNNSRNNVKLASSRLYRMVYADILSNGLHFN